MAATRIISDQELEDGLSFVAYLIGRYGDVYWPVFEKLESELEKRRSRAARLCMRSGQNAQRAIHLTRSF